MGRGNPNGFPLSGAFFRGTPLRMRAAFTPSVSRSVGKLSCAAQKRGFACARRRSPLAAGGTRFAPRPARRGGSSSSQKVLRYFLGALKYFSRKKFSVDKSFLEVGGRCFRRGGLFRGRRSDFRRGRVAFFGRACYNIPQRKQGRTSPFARLLAQKAGAARGGRGRLRAAPRTKGRAARGGWGRGSRPHAEKHFHG